MALNNCLELISINSFSISQFKVWFQNDLRFHIISLRGDRTSTHVREHQLIWLLLLTALSNIDTPSHFLCTWPGHVQPCYLSREEPARKRPPEMQNSGSSSGKTDADQVCWGVSETLSSSRKIQGKFNVT